MVQPKRTLLGHMHQATAEAMAFVEGLSKAQFLADRRTQQAVLMSLIVLGEASTKLAQAYPAWADANPQLPLRSMRGMRNRLAHGYFEIDFDVVWDTVAADLPPLAQAIADALVSIAVDSAE